LKVNIISDNQDFKDDLELQISKYSVPFTLNADKPDVIVLDENAEAITALRKSYPSVPIILLTTLNQAAADKLNLVLPKPFRLLKLFDMILAANNELDNSEEGQLVFNSYELHPNMRKIVDLQTGEVTKLTEREVAILKYLYKTPGDYVSKNDLQTNVWQYSHEVDTHTIETHIYRLRQKVEKNNGRRLILTENGKYKLNMDASCRS